MAKVTKNYVHVGEKFWIVETDEQGQPRLSEATEEQILHWEFERIAIRDSADQVDESIFQDIINKTQADMERGLTESLKRLILSGLGVSQSHDGGFSIHGFNDKGSVIGKHIAEKLADRFKEVDLNKELDLTDLEKKKLRAAMKEKFKKDYESEVSSLVWKEAKALAAKHVKEEMESTMGDKLKTVAKALVERALNKKHYYGD